MRLICSFFRILICKLSHDCLFAFLSTVPTQNTPLSTTIAVGVGASAFTIVVSLLFAGLLFRALINTRGNQSAWFLDLEKPSGPTAELTMIIVVLICNTTSLALFHWGDNEATDEWGLVKNPNLYYGRYACRHKLRLRALIVLLETSHHMLSR